MSLQQTKMRTTSRKNFNEPLRKGKKCTHKTFKIIKSGYIPAVVVKKTGSFLYKVQLEDGRVTHCHVDHLHSRAKKIQSDTQQDQDDWPVPSPMGSIV